MPAEAPLDHLCPSCGHVLPGEAMMGHCPRCLLAEITSEGSDQAESEESESAISPSAERAERITGYQLGSKLGEGGFAIVYQATQREPVRREVALKILKSGLGGEQAIARFEAERQALAILDHPAIARIYDAGETELGRPYFAMELVVGQSVTDYCVREALSVNQRLDLFLRICDGVQHAHQKGIIHRDLKPSNLLVSHLGQPKIIDFGIARATDQNLCDLPLVTNPAQMLGTPAYMAPEQAAMQSEAIDTRTDVHALGAILYELLSGSPPFGELERSAPVPFDELVRRIREDDPPKPSSRTATPIPGDLDWIVLKALRKRPAERYSSVVELCADLERHRDNQPIEARPPSLTYVIHKFGRRHRALTAAALAASLVLIAGSVVSTALYLRAEENAKKAKANEQRALASEASEKTASSRSDFLAAGMLLRHDQPVEAIAHLARAVRSDPRNHAARFKLLYYLASENFVQPALPPLMHEGIVHAVAVSPDRSLVASVSNDGTARIWRLADGSLVRTLLHEQVPLCVAFSPNGERLLTAGHDRAAFLWDISTGELLHRFAHRGTVWSSHFSPDGRQVLTASEDRRAVLWDAGNGAPLHRLELGSDRYTRARFAAGGRFVITRADRTVQVWNARTGEAHGTPIERGGTVMALGLDRSGTRVAIADEAGFAQVFDLETGAPLSPPLAHGAPLRTIDLSPDGSRVATGTRHPDQSLRIWKTSGSLAAPPRQYGDDLEDVRFTATGDRLVAVARTRDPSDPAIRFWDAATGEPRSAPVALPRGVKTMALASDETVLVTGARDFAVRVWDIRPRAMQPLELKCETPRVWNVTFTPDGSAVGAVSRGGKAALWDASTGERRGLDRKEIFPTVLAGWSGANLTEGVRGSRLNLAYQQVEMNRTSGPPSMSDFFPSPFDKCYLQTAAASSDGGTLATGCIHGTIRLWNVVERTLLREPLQLHSAAQRIASLSRLQAFAVSTRDGRLVIVPASGDPETELCATDDESYATCLAVSPNGEQLAAGFSNGSLRLWNLAGTSAGDPLVCEGHRGEVRQIVFTPDGERMVSGSADRKTHVWNVRTGALLHRVSGHIDEVPPWGITVAVSADGETLVTSGSNDNTARAWDLASGRSLAPPMQGATGSYTLLMGHRSGYFANGMDANFEVALWDPRTGEPVTPLLKHSQRSSALAFSPDERRLATGSWDRTVRVWDLPPGDRLLPEWLLQFAEAHAGLRLDSRGLPQAIERGELEQRQAAVRNLEPGDDPVVRWAQWLAAEPGPTRPRSPWAANPRPRPRVSVDRILRSLSGFGRK